MKKAILSLLSFLLLANFATAQEDGAKLAKSAGKALTAYNLDPASNKDKLTEAKEKIEKAVATAEGAALSSAWVTRGEIYNTILQNDFARRSIDKTAPLSDENGALFAFNSFKKGHELAQKKFEKTQCLKGIAEVQSGLINIGAAQYDKKDYANAFNNFRSALESHDLLKSAGEKSLLEEQALFDNTFEITIFSALQSKKHAEIVPVLEKALKDGNKKPVYYESLYNCKLEMGDEKGAQAVLAEGRAAFPDDTGLLFAEINVYLKAGRLAELVSRLEKAIEKEPLNAGLHVTLGNVYDNLYQQALKDKKTDEANKNLELAKKYYQLGSEKDPKNVDAIYSLGALYYNNAALKTAELIALNNDMSKEGQKKYDILKGEIEKLFDLALPYFQKAESLDANDVNTLIALKEIYTRKEDELALEFKKRLDTVQGGGKNAGSHFKN